MTEATGPISAIRPAYITATRSAVSAITPMSCVTSITDGAVLSRQRLQQRDDLRLHRNIQRGGRFVGDHQFGFGAQRQRDDHALPLAAGEFVRPGIDAA